MPTYLDLNKLTNKIKSHEIFDQYLIKLFVLGNPNSTVAVTPAHRSRICACDDCRAYPPCAELLRNRYCTVLLNYNQGHFIAIIT